MTATAGVVDLTNVKEGGNFRPRQKPEGDYLARIVKADDHQPNDKAKPKGWVLTIQVDGDARSTYPYYISPDPKQAWKISGIMRACGLNVKNAKIKFDPNKLVNKALGIALRDEEYNGRTKSVIDDVFTTDEVSPSADEDTVEETIEDIDLPDDEEIEEEYEEEPEPTPAPKKRVARKPVPEPEPEDEEEEEPAPVRRRKAAPPAKKVARKPAPVEDDDDDLEELDTDDLDDLD